MENASLSQNNLQAKFNASDFKQNITVNKIKNQLSGLELNNFCQNKWVHSNGKCFYFSTEKVTIKKKYTKLIWPRKGSHQKKVKKFHNKCELSPKMENPPPISQQF